MGWIAGLFSKGIAEPVDAVGNAFDKIFTSDEEKMQAQAVLDKIKQKPELLKAEIIKLQAQHKSIFVAGARPFLVWCSGFVYVGLGVAVMVFDKAVPEWYADATISALLGALGLYGSMRTIEKVTDKSK